MIFPISALKAKPIPESRFFPGGSPSRISCACPGRPDHKLPYAGFDEKAVNGKKIGTAMRPRPQGGQGWRRGGDHHLKRGLLQSRWISSFHIVTTVKDTAMQAGGHS